MAYGHNVLTALPQTKVKAPFVGLRYLCGCVTLINRISTEADIGLLLCSCIRLTDALICSISPFSDSNATVKLRTHSTQASRGRQRYVDSMRYSGGNSEHTECGCQAANN